MKYLYTAEHCPLCHIRKKDLIKNNIPFEERSAERLNGGEETDPIDTEAHIQLNMNNMKLPVEFDMEVGE